MPIEKKIFETAKNPAPLIEEFLKNNPTMAYTEEEIYNSIKELKELDIPSVKLRETLSNLIRESKIEFAMVKGEAYYKIIDRTSLFNF